jgi:hypothetical protein
MNADRGNHKEKKNHPQIDADLSTPLAPPKGQTPLPPAAGRLFNPQSSGPTGLSYHFSPVTYHCFPLPSPPAWAILLVSGASLMKLRRNGWWLTCISRDGNVGADIKDLSLDEVAEMMAGCQPDSMSDQKAKAEFLRRQTKAIQDSAAATGRYTLYMLVSVILLLVSVIGTLLFSYLDYISSR